MTKTYRFGGARYCASVEFAGRKIQVSYRTPSELVRALRDMSTSQTANLRVLKVYAKGLD
jgi:hypothetical protein